MMSKGGQGPRFEPGDSVWAELDKRRHAVILLIQDEQALLLFGTGTERDYPPSVRVSERSPEGVRLGLRKLTYFYARNFRVVGFDKLEHKPRSRQPKSKCPESLYMKLAAAYDEAMERGKRGGR